MWKWLHRGMVTVLLLICLSAAAVHLATFEVAMPTSHSRFTESSGPFLSFHLPDRNFCVVLRWSEQLSTETDPHARLTITTTFYDYIFCRYAVAKRIETIGPDYRRVDSTTVGVIEFSPLQVASLALIYPVLFGIGLTVRSYRRRRLLRQVLQPCGQCGYDLHGNESGTCPECGTAIAPSTNMEGLG